MPKKKKIIVGMSGGVDSSVLAFLLKNLNYKVIGVSFILYESKLRRYEEFKKVPCCSLEALNTAKAVAKLLEIDYLTVDLRAEFIEKVVEPFIEGYKKGKTPNPCILCNKYIKFPSLLKLADDLDADYISTGHYARVERGCLYKGRDPSKDQSYFLYILTPQILERLILPLGDLTKEEVRKIAKKVNLPVFNRPESQEICFIEDKHYFTFLEKLIEKEEGPIIDIYTGKKIGIHQGIHRYTIGQRKGLGISIGYPLYVVKIDPEKKVVYVGKREEVFRKEFLVKDLNWIIKKEENFQAFVKIRSTMKEAQALIEKEREEEVKVLFKEPQWAPTPGQSAVFYEGDLVIGGGIIEG